MTDGDKWLLPDGVDELLPPFARQLELMRRKVLDFYDSCGYSQLSPALFEYIESLLVGAGEHVSLQTFKMTDQLTGRLLGLRADITPQVSRIAARLTHANSQAKNKANNKVKSKADADKDSCTLRLCYSEPILHATPSHLMASRTLLQTGAELYGHKGVKSDIEVVQLMLESLRLVIPENMPENIPGEHSLTLELGHAGILQGIVSELGISGGLYESLISILHRKAVPELNAFILQLQSDPDRRTNEASLARLEVLVHLYGDESVLDVAKEKLKGAPERVLQDIEYLCTINDELKKRYPGIGIYFDLSDFRGYDYYTGLVFAAYVHQFSEPIAKGGRYNGTSSDTGQPATATGYSMDLMQIITSVGANQFVEPEAGVFAGAEVPRAAINRLRSEGHRVIQSLTGEPEEPQQLGCSHIIRNNNSQWVVERLNG